MLNQQTLILSPEKAHDMEQRFRVVKRSIDARQKQLKVHLTVLTDEHDAPLPKDAPIPLYEPPHFQDVHNAEHSVAIIGAGPAGLFAALTLIEHGIRPIIYERGKDVAERKKDIATLNRNLGLNAESNYCFGEGGAGTFSDGKLFSRSKKRGNMQRVMELFHHFGGDDRLLYEAHAHIGSDKLPTIIRRMRECIIEHGGEIHFSTCVDEALFRLLLGLTAKRSNSEHSKAVRQQSGLMPILGVILAIGHSAHDTYHMLHDNGVALATKGFAMGVRAEHPQSLINKLMYHDPSPELIHLVGNASYSLVTQVQGRGVYSFCMCPGGHIVPAGSALNSCVVNGMSASHRNSPYANSGMVVEIRPEDLNEQDPLAGLRFQQHLEYLSYQHGGVPSLAPAQRLRDFVEGKASKTLPSCSYLPGTVSSRLDQWLPEHIGKRLQQGFRDFDRKYRGFLTNEAVILGVESRSSSAVRLPRDPETLQSISTPHLYPCGEGAGYAGGITSSALDGINVALKIASYL
ncbi:MAG: FAD-dependent monooxygenase [Paludibacteraceae bacterium]|nr:FAD-dependent monooxygenase [Paludibacteraceae bacterium]